MSLAHSRGPRHKGDEPRAREDEGWALASSLRSESRPRSISQPASVPDEASHDSPKNPRGSPYIHPHGNAKPGEPAFLQRRPSNSHKEPRKAGHIHARPWSSSSAPGRKENPHHENVFHRTWMSDCGLPGRPLARPAKEFASERLKTRKDGTKTYDSDAIRRAMSEPRRWTRASKKEYYDKSEEELASMKCADEMFAVGTNAKFWTHLLNNGVTAGGMSEKLDMAPKRKTGMHLKSGLYKGRFENVQHKQVILCARRNKGEKRGKEERQVDERPPFDNRLKDDMIRANDVNAREVAAASLELFCPSTTRSCPQMGAEWMYR